MIPFHVSGDEKRILHGAVLDKHNRRVGMRGTLIDFIGGHVGQAVVEVNGRIEFREHTAREPDACACPSHCCMLHGDVALP